MGDFGVTSLNFLGEFLYLHCNKLVAITYAVLNSLGASYFSFKAQKRRFLVIFVVFGQKKVRLNLLSKTLAPKMFLGFLRGSNGPVCKNLETGHFH